jgi:hypothetical protein
MFSKYKTMMKEGVELALYEHPLFNNIAEVSEFMEMFSFKESCNMIGCSLITDFSEIDS